MKFLYTLIVIMIIKHWSELFWYK